MAAPDCCQQLAAVCRFVLVERDAASPAVLCQLGTVICREFSMLLHLPSVHKPLLVHFWSLQSLSDIFFLTDGFVVAIYCDM